MAIQNEPSRITIPFAASGTKNTIPDTQPSPSASQAASWTDGFAAAQLAATPGPTMAP